MYRNIAYYWKHITEKSSMDFKKKVKCSDFVYDDSDRFYFIMS